MGIQTKSEVDSLIKLRKNSSSGDKNHQHFCKVYSRHDVNWRALRDNLDGYNTIPSSIYFIYLSFNADKQLEVKQYKYKSNSEIGIQRPQDPDPSQDIRAPIEIKIESILESVLENIEGEPGTGRYMHGLRALPDYNFEKMVWDEPCYVAIAFNESAWRFHDSSSEYSAVQMVTQDEFGNPYAENVTFFDGQTFQATQHKIPVFYMVNHFKKSPSNMDDYKFDLFLRVKFAIGGEGAPEKTIIIDPTGENNGPPDNDDVFSAIFEKS